MDSGGRIRRRVGHKGDNGTGASVPAQRVIKISNSAYFKTTMFSKIPLAECISEQHRFAPYAHCRFGVVAYLAREYICGSMSSVFSPAP
jgi:hypothetical protein